MIKIGSNYLSLQNTNVEAFIKVAYDLRLDIVDFHQRAFASTNPEYLSNIKMLCLRYGLPIGYIGVSGLFIGTDAQRQEHLQRCKDAIDLAAFLGAPIIRVFCATSPEKDTDDGNVWSKMIIGYQEVADYASQKGIAVGLQNHPSTGDEMLAIQRETDRKNFAFIVDTGQWIGSPGASPRGETDTDVDFYHFMEQTVPYAMYIRTKFYKIESGREEWLDYERIIGILKNIKYNGCISIVYEGQKEDRVEQIRLAANYLRQLLENH